MGLMISQVMRFYQGSVSFNEILEMPYKTFLMLFDYMLWQSRYESEDGAKINKRVERTDLIKAFGSKAVSGSESKNVESVIRSIKQKIE